MIEAYCLYLVEDKFGAQSLLWLADQKWMKWSMDEKDYKGFHQRVFVEMNEQTSVVCARWARELDEEHEELEKTEFVQIVYEWAVANDENAESKKEAALYLIYHSVPSDGPYRNMKVYKPLWDIFCQLHADPQMKKVMKLDHMKKWYSRQTKHYSICSENNAE